MKKLKLLGLSCIIILTFGLLVGCSSGNSEEKESSKMKKVTTIKGEVEIPENPKRIVDISGSSEELLILGYKTVGTANIDSYETDKLPSYINDKLEGTKIVGHSMMDTMDIEGIIALNPDLIIMADRQAKIYDQLKGIAPVVMLKEYNNDWKEKLSFIGEVFGKQDDAKKWLESYESKAKKVGEEIKAKVGDGSYLPILPFTGQYMIFTSGGIGSIIYEDLGLKKPDNLPKQETITLPTVSIEGLSKIDSDHVFVITTDADKKQFENNSVWSHMRAVKSGNVTMFNASPVFTQSYNPIGREMLLETIKNELIK